MEPFAVTNTVEYHEIQLNTGEQKTVECHQIQLNTSEEKTVECYSHIEFVEHLTMNLDIYVFWVTDRSIDYINNNVCTITDLSK